LWCLYAISQGASASVVGGKNTNNGNKGASASVVGGKNTNNGNKVNIQNMVERVCKQPIIHLYTG
jgi:hypothetical protein